MQISSKVYYEKATGTVLVITSEVQGNIENPTHEDMQVYEQLRDKNINDIDFIELEFGTLGTIFNNSKNYHVDLETNKLNINYYTDEELNNIKIQYQNTQELNNRVGSISEYLSEQPNETITDVENYIVQNELNKVMEAMN